MGLTRLCQDKLIYTYLGDWISFQRARRDHGEPGADGRLVAALELEKKDTVVTAGSVYKVLSMYRKNRAKFLYVPNAMLSGDSDCTVLLTFDDIPRRVTNQKVIHIPKCIMQSGRGPYSDITGVTLEQFAKKTGVTVKVLHKIDTRYANELLYRNGSLQNFVENYLQSPMRQEYEALPCPA